jgi:hypothetical protein
VIGGSTPAAINGTTGAFSGDVDIADKIVHTGDTNTAIRFPAVDTVTVETAGIERLRVDSSGNVGIGTTSPSSYPVAPELVVDTGTNGGITIKSGTSNYGGIFFADGTTGAEQYRGFVQYNHDWVGITDALTLGTAAIERLRIDNSGNVTVSTGNLIIGTSGKGIDFSATSDAAGATSELFDDYEEGTWTPADGSGAGLAITSSNATYTKIGNTVRVTATLLYPSNSDVSNTLVSGLPFTAGGNAPLAFFNSTATAGDAATIANGTSGVYFYTTSLTRRTNIQYSGAIIYLSGVYFV